LANQFTSAIRGLDDAAAIDGRSLESKWTMVILQVLGCGQAGGAEAGAAARDNPAR
jgi:hypothetical protein